MTPGSARLRPFDPFTTRFVNPVIRLFAGWLPGFGNLGHVGRRSGRHYRTPLMVFQRGDTYVIALGSGSGVQWVQNVLAAGGGELQIRGRRLQVGEPRIWVDPGMLPLPRRLRWFGSMIGLTEFLSLREADPIGAERQS